MGRRVLVCGSREYRDGSRFEWLMNTLHESEPFDVVIEGGARGADRLARHWANTRGIPVETYEADWTKYGRGAGPIRNSVMLTEGKPDLVIAFPLKESIGTVDMITKAQAAGVRCVVDEVCI